MQVIGGLAFTSFLLIAGSPGGPSVGEAATYAIIGFGLFIGAYRTFLMRVVVVGKEITIHGFTRTRKIAITNVQAEIVDFRVVAYLWAPVVTEMGQSHALALLGGYGSRKRPNGRVARGVSAIAESLEES
ncbi:hypothetical protein N865_02480 [Intrasporangium oryzae NRRL B-24470]|uniref:Uncharacterized protein n=2 Tax=Intrasporangium TaxID=53357 RepID=W9GCS0_9MICO|nr:hypothetical protein N865_02480 [Intrasporangium oryzae NRRL B-24470]